ncbi:MAG: protein kinase [Sandaracinaceae bacterium]|nr:protein kinase [Sandaracinaceae bacterium]
MVDLPERAPPRARVPATWPEGPSAPIAPGTLLGDYEVRGVLGVGAMGAVYEAYDLARDRALALKVLSLGRAEAVRALKREFRAAAAISHPNVVSLYELVLDEDVSFFTMERVRGVPLTEHVARAADRPSAIRAAFAALADGLGALHARGVLHLDLKPDNILVEPSGRVVILDFGFARLLDPSDGALREEGGMTPAYAAPERLLGHAAGEAADWYCVGMMLYEALAGRRPFEGPTTTSVVKKLRGLEAPAVDARDADLAALAAALLAPEPTARPHGEALARALGRTPRPTPLPAPTVVGRDAELARLREAKDRWLAGAPVRVWVRGGSGSGKSALLSRFTEELRAELDGALVLTTRCRPLERVAHDVIDGWVDALVAALRDEPASAAGVVPADIAGGEALFPALGRLRAHAPAGAPIDRGPQEILRALFDAVARQRRLVLVADDLHLGDRDSARLFMGWFGASPPLPVLFVGAVGEPRRARGFVDELEARAAQAWMRGHDVELALSPLGDEASAALAQRWLDGASEPRARALARAAAGNPGQLYVLASVAGDAVDADALDLTTALRRRVDELGPACARAFAALAIARGPLPQRVVAAIAGGQDEEPLRRLEGARFVTLPRLHPDEPVELRHDLLGRVWRDATPDAERARVTQALLSTATALDAVPHARVALYREAGEIERAAEHAVEAARTASRAGAHDQAAELLEIADAWDGWPRATRRELRRARADALAAASRAAEAARLFEALAQDGGTDTDRRRALELFMTSGHLEEGRTHLYALLARAGIDLPRGPIGGLARALSDLARDGLRRRAVDDDADDEGLELLLAGSRGLIATEFFRGAQLAVHGLSLSARRGGRRQRAHFAAIVGGTVLGPFGGPLLAWGRALLAEAVAIGEASGDTALLGVVDVLEGQLHLARGEFLACHRLSTRGQRRLRGRPDLRFERNIGRMGALRAAEELGRYDEVALRSHRYLREAQEAADQYGTLTFAFSSSLAALAADRPEAALELVRTAARGRQADRFEIQDLYVGRALAMAHVYGGAPAAAAADLDRMWPGLQRSQLLRIDVARIDALSTRARVDLARADAGDRAGLGRARDDGRALARIARADARGIGALVLAGHAAATGAEAEALAQTQRALDAFAEGGLLGLHACARARLAELRGAHDERARALGDVDAAGAVHPERWLSMMAPGFRARNTR